MYELSAPTTSMLSAAIWMSSDSAMQPPDCAEYCLQESDLDLSIYSVVYDNQHCYCLTGIDPEYQSSKWNYSQSIILGLLRFS